MSPHLFFGVSSSLSSVCKQSLVSLSVSWPCHVGVSYVLVWLLLAFMSAPLFLSSVLFLPSLSRDSMSLCQAHVSLSESLCACHFLFYFDSLTCFAFSFASPVSLVGSVPAVFSTCSSNSRYAVY